MVFRSLVLPSARRIGTSAPLAMLLAISFVVVGCSQPTTGIVTGTITVDGQPMESGMIAFFAVDRRAPTTGARIENGKYRAEVRPGLCRVEIRLSHEQLPNRYHDESELTLDVKLGDNVQNYELTTD